MAVANIAFLAALNGRRVLTMDWDLEAPGLAYYFRGLMDSAIAKQLRETAGIMDYVWDWSNSINQAKDDNDIFVLKSRYENGQIFEESVCSVIENRFLPNGGCLDFIGAGRKWTGKDRAIPYEDALANFSWNSFFSKEAGGYVLESLKQWAKENYDLILIDSRTGLADVAGICTMQLPDTVAMCFILNRQNIDGVARVASAIRLKRKDDIRLHAVPMRVSRSENPEESDAKARANTELTKIGGFPADLLAEDFRTMSIAAADNVPFYESLAPFYAADPTLDPLTLNYLRLANQLLTPQLDIPHFDRELMENAVRRLAPRNATVEYLAKLRSAEPARASSELRRLLDSALDTEVNGGELAQEYVTTLTDVAFSIGETSEEYGESLDLQTKALDLVRAIAPTDIDKWSVTLTTLLQRHLESFSGILEPEEEHQIEAELDALLASRPTISNQFRRIAYKRARARRSVGIDEIDAARQIVGEYLVIVSDITKTKTRLSADQMDEILAAEVDALLISGDVYGKTSSPDRALREYISGIEKLRDLELNSSKGDLTRLRHDLHFRIAGILNGMGYQKEAGLHAVAALNWGQNSTQVAVRFMDLAEIIIRVSKNEPDIALKFCEALLSGTDAKRYQLAAYNSRVTKNTAQFLSMLLQLCHIINQSHSDRRSQVIIGLIGIADLVASVLVRRRRTIGDKLTQEIGTLIEGFFDALEQVNSREESFIALREFQSFIKPRRGKDTN